MTSILCARSFGWAIKDFLLWCCESVASLTDLKIVPYSSPSEMTFNMNHDKTSKVTVRPAKTQISLGIHPVWSESLLCAEWVVKDPSFLHADNKDSDQTGRMPRLIWVFAGCTVTLLVLSCCGSYTLFFLWINCFIRLLWLRNFGIGCRDSSVDREVVSVTSYIPLPHGYELHWRQKKIKKTNKPAGMYEWSGCLPGRSGFREYFPAELSRTILAFRHLMTAHLHPPWR